MAQYGMPTLSPLANRTKASSKLKKTAASQASQKGHVEERQPLEKAASIALGQRRPLPDETVDKLHLHMNAPRTDENGVIAIDEHGDLVINIGHQTTLAKLEQKYRVSTATLRATSRYFASLLDGRFGESAKIEQQHTIVRQRYNSLAEAPTSELPLIHIEDIGRISSIKSIEALCTDFLLVLHGQDTLALPPVANLANIAIVADRFDALDTVRTYAARKRLIRGIDGKTIQKAENGLAEERVRQRLLVAVLLDHAPWVDRYSARLITKGWVGKEAGEADAMWWSLPQNLEEELLLRREYVLDMLQASIAQIVASYTSRDRQCRLGYDSSAACDSFQLGEMIRFLARTGIIQLKEHAFELYDASAC